MPHDGRCLRTRRTSAATIAVRCVLGLVAAVTATSILANVPAAEARELSAQRQATPHTRVIPPVRPTRVLVLGDSVMKGADARYVAELPGREVVVDTEVSRSTGAGADVLAKLGSDWDVVVVLLGHNDGGSPGAYQPAARRILDQLRGVRRVTWLTIHEVRPYYPSVNRYLDGLRSSYPNLHIADWNAVARANPGAVAGDGLHLTPQGSTLMGDLVARQVEETEYEFAVALNRLTASVTSTTTTPTTTATTAAPPAESSGEGRILPGRGAGSGGGGPNDDPSRGEDAAGRLAEEAAAADQTDDATGGGSAGWSGAWVIGAAAVAAVAGWLLVGSVRTRTRTHHRPRP